MKSGFGKDRLIQFNINLHMSPRSDSACSAAKKHHVIQFMDEFPILDRNRITC